ncbi:MAG: hypothetical protein LBE13_18925 [Bacteroidales bacterium]|jgi:hypothetical protein|nr:hypothetical protein [Bacteroidales bacterium]
MKGKIKKLMILISVILSVLLCYTTALLLYKGNLRFGFCYFKKPVSYFRIFHAPTIWQLGKNNFDRDPVLLLQAGAMTE